MVLRLYSEGPDKTAKFLAETVENRVDGVKQLPENTISEPVMSIMRGVGDSSKSILNRLTYRANQVSEAKGFVSKSGSYVTNAFGYLGDVADVTVMTEAVGGYANILQRITTGAASIPTSLFFGKSITSNFDARHYITSTDEGKDFAGNRIGQIKQGLIDVTRVFGLNQNQELCIKSGFAGIYSTLNKRYKNDINTAQMVSDLISTGVATTTQFYSAMKNVAVGTAFGTVSLVPSILKQVPKAAKLAWSGTKWVASKASQGAKWVWSGAKDARKDRDENGRLRSRTQKTKDFFFRKDK